jgi:hypothetical protein
VSRNDEWKKTELAETMSCSRPERPDAGDSPTRITAPYESMWIYVNFIVADSLHDQTMTPFPNTQNMSLSPDHVLHEP